MLLKDNKQHIRAFTMIAQACSTVRKFEVRDDDRYFLCTLQNNGMGSDDMCRLLAVTWAEHKGSIHIPLRGKWYARLKPAIDGKYAAYELILTSKDKRSDTCVHAEHYNATGGYYYTSQYDLSPAGLAAMRSRTFTSLRAIVSAFNRACYYR